MAVAAALSLAALTAVAGCMVGPDYKTPQTAAPNGFGELANAENSGAATRPTTDTPVVQWWRTFDDPTLDALVTRAVEANRDLRRARARVRESRASRDVVRADLFPGVGTSGSYTHSRSPAGLSGGTATGTGSTGGTGGTGGTGTTGGVAGSTGSQSVAGFSGEFDLYQAGFDATWEIDVFGGVRRGVEAANGDIGAAVEDERNVLVTLLGDLARSYVELRGFQRQAFIARENLKTQQDTLELTRNRLKAGLTTDLAVAQAEAQVASTASTIPTLDAAARQSIHAIGVLVGQPPLALADELSPPKAIPQPPPTLPIGLPSDLLRRRPDIRRAERQLAAATARVGVATADLFPKFSLTGSLGTQGLDGADLFNWGNRFYSIGPSITWPLFDAGRIRANIRVQDARQEQAAMVYEQAVLTAFKDVEDALVSYLREADRRQKLVAAAEANGRAVRLATQLYEAGRTDFLNVLQAQRDLFASQDALVQSDRTVSTNLVALYKALGGGWESDGDPGATRPAPDTLSAPATQPIAATPPVASATGRN